MNCSNECTILTCGKKYCQGNLIQDYIKCSPDKQPSTEKPFDLEEWIQVINEMQQS